MLPLPISPSEVKHIARLPKYKGQEYLARKLQLSPIDEEDDLKSALLVDYYYDVLQYAVNRGMAWKDVVSCLNFASDILDATQGQVLVTAVRLLQNMAVNYVSEGKITLQNAQLICKYLTGTFLAHFKLYQYVLSRPQEEHRGHVSLMVEVPTELMKLADADTLQVWEYANKMNEIDKKEEDKRVEVENQRLEIEKKSECMENDIKAQFLEGEIKSLSLNDAEKLISEVATTKLSLLVEDIGTNITEMKDSTDIAIQRQAIPVPPDWKNSQTFLAKNASQNKPKSPEESRKSSAKSASSRKKK
ncbi:uncharacterized protein C8orf74 homolog [Styela clava]